MPKVFSEAAIKYFGEVYSRSNAHKILEGGCMNAAYQGISSLFGQDYALTSEIAVDFRKTTSQNAFDNLMEHLETSITEKEGTFKALKNGKWKTAGNRTIDSFEKHLMDSANCLPGNSQFYGISVKGAQHSLILRVDKMTGDIYWMDQNSNGYDKRFGSELFTQKYPSPKITGKFDERIRNKKGKGVTAVWRFVPENAEDIEIPIDTTGDGKYDSTTAAVVEVEDTSCVSQETIPPNTDEIDTKESPVINQGDDESDSSQDYDATAPNDDSEQGSDESKDAICEVGDDELYDNQEDDPDSTEDDAEQDSLDGEDAICEVSDDELDDNQEDEADSTEDDTEQDSLEGEDAIGETEDDAGASYDHIEDGGVEGENDTCETGDDELEDNDEDSSDEEEEEEDDDDEQEDNEGEDDICEIGDDELDSSSDAEEAEAEAQAEEQAQAQAEAEAEAEAAEEQPG